MAKGKKTADRNPLPELAPEHVYVDPKAKERAARVEAAIPDPPEVAPPKGIDPWAPVSPPDPGPAFAPPPPGELPPPRFRNRNKGEKRVRASAIVRNPHNFRTHPEFQQKAVGAILERIGFVGKLLVRELDDGRYELIDGHLRSDLLGDDDVDVVVTDLSEAESLELLAVYDKTTALAVHDDEKLRALLADLSATGTPLGDMGWPEWELSQLLPPEYAPGGGGGGGTTPEATPPAEFPEHNETIKVDHVCPRCGYSFSGGKTTPAGSASGSGAE